MTIQNHPAVKAVAGITLAAALIFLLMWMVFLFKSVVHNPEGVKYTVTSGATMKSVMHDLEEADILKHPWFFNVLVDMKGVRHSLKSGEYFFPKGTTSRTLLRQITTGTGLARYEFTIIAGWNFKQVREALLRNEAVDHDTATLTDAEVMEKIGQPHVHPEGAFFPDTYFFTKGYPDAALLKRAYQLMQTKLAAAWATREPGLPYKTPIEAVTAASLVEKEAAVAKDRPLIAGVILNRLHKNMPLQLDPTVIYAAGDKFNGTIHRKELQSKNPYNTYTNKGLPPTPIAMPSMEALQATLHPDHHDYIYFVAKGNGRREHQFSKTLAEHNKAVLAARENKTHKSFFNSMLIRFYFARLVFAQIQTP